MVETWHLALCVLQHSRKLDIFLVDCLHALSPNSHVKATWLMLVLHTVLPVHYGHELSKHLFILLVHFSLLLIVKTPLLIIDIIAKLRIEEVLPSIHVC